VEAKSCVISHSDFARYLTVSGLDEDAAIDTVKAASLKLESVALRHRLAKVYNNAGVDVLENHDDFKEYCNVSGLDRDDAIERLSEVARGYCETFWANFNALKDYHATYPSHVMNVEGKRILIVESEGKYNTLYLWVMTMSGYYEKSASTRSYGFCAFQHMGSVEQIALAGLDVSFDPDALKKALDTRIGDRLMETRDNYEKNSEIMSLGRDLDW